MFVLAPKVLMSAYEWCHAECRGVSRRVALCTEHVMTTPRDNHFHSDHYTKVHLNELDIFKCGLLDHGSDCSVSLCDCSERHTPSRHAHRSQEQ